MTMSIASIQFTEDMVGQGHATKSDTLNRLVVGVNNFRLIKSGDDLTLQPVNGNLVDINGTIYAVTTLPTLAPGPAAADTLYYIYLYSSSGTATLEWSTTSYTVDTVGRANKTGTATKRLMGIARTNDAAAWVDSVTQRYVVSASNGLARSGYDKFSANRALTNQLTYAEINTELRVAAVFTGGESAIVTVNGSLTSTTAGEISYTGIGLDDTEPPTGAGVGIYTTGTDYYMNVALARSFPASDLTVGMHYFSLWGATGGNYDVTWLGSGSVSDVCMNVIIVPAGGA